LDDNVLFDDVDGEEDDIDDVSLSLFIFIKLQTKVTKDIRNNILNTGFDFF